MKIISSANIWLIFVTVHFVQCIYIPPEEKKLNCKERQKAGSDPFILHCADDGSFKPLQCDDSTNLCYCVHPERGTVYYETAVDFTAERAQGQDCDKYWQKQDAQNDAVVPMILKLPVDQPIDITALSNDFEENAEDKKTGVVQITSANLPQNFDEQGDFTATKEVTKTDADVTHLSQPIAVPVPYKLEDDATATKEVTKTDADVTHLSPPIAVPVLYKLDDDDREKNQTELAGRPIPVLYDKVPTDVHIDADNHTNTPDVEPTEDIPPVVALSCNKTITNCSQDVFNATSNPIETTGEYNGYNTKAPSAIQQSHVAKLLTIPEKSYLFDLRVTSMKWTPSLKNTSSEEYVSMEKRCHDMMLPLFEELPGFLALKILGFKEGSIIVEHEALFDYTRVTSSDDLSSRLRDAVEGGTLDPNMTFDSLVIYDDADIDLCDYAQCEDHSQCVAPPGEKVPLCRCHTGYGSLEGSVCTSRCELEPGYCHNDGRCDVEPELGVICRCRAGASWWHVGERCETYMSYFMVFSIGGGAVGGVFVIMLLSIIIVAKRVPNKTRPSNYFPSHYRRPFFIEANGSTVLSGPSTFSETTWKENPMFIDEQEEDIYSTISRKVGQEISRELRELEATDIEDPYGIIGMFAKAESGISTAGTKLPPGDWNGVVRFKPTVECIDPNWKFKIKRPRYAFNPEYDQQRDDLSWP
ncbi:PREDICTED: interphotoreceptor matrix proteoglycan 2-like [Branchiostoma belcheri]|uniref:Interphotoreceptor matrix proteoglycan 2-like n=1 Tax=Branchiostoma belcheri TaxID=7741 RepID=A0A6P4XKU2_BRABE|nr:PREDICTED: interphotoreceptor matrix proteoglycan 2-like [Branchiostoma belcheri]